MNIERIQDELRRAQLDGWLLTDHHGRDPIAYHVLGIHSPGHVSRRWYFFIPATGGPCGLVHRIESSVLDTPSGHCCLPHREYSTWREHHDGLRQILGGARRVAMQYSPQCAIPYIANVDAGTVELVRSFGIEVVSSAELVQLFEARWTPAQLDMHLEAGRRVDRIRADAFELVSEKTRGGVTLTEFDLQQFVMKRFSESGLVTNFPPIVAVNDHAANPHYAPTQSGCRPIFRDDLLLLDLWAKLDEPEAVYYDITWTAFCGYAPPAKMRGVFEIVREPRDAGVRFVSESVAAGRQIKGFEVDDVVRGVIAAKGLAEYFTHRTGHSLGRETHGNGANMDNFETHDERTIIPWTCFSIEPGIYLPEFGVRSEVNVFVDETGARVTGEVQKELLVL